MTASRIPETTRAILDAAPDPRTTGLYSPGPALPDVPDAAPDAPVAAQGAMMAVELTWSDAFDAVEEFGYDPPSVVFVPLATWPTADDEPIELADVTIAPWRAPRKPRPAPRAADGTFKRRAPEGFRSLPDLPAAQDPGTPLIPREVWNWLVERLPLFGPIEPIESNHPALSRVVAAGKAALATAPRNRGANLDTEWGLLAYNLEVVARRAALPDEEAVEVLRHKGGAALDEEELLARVRAVRESGCSLRSDLRDEEVAAAATAAAAAKEARRLAKLAPKPAVAVDVDLAAAGFVLFESGDPEPFGKRMLLLSGGLPVTEGQIEVRYRTSEFMQSSLYATIRASGTVKLARDEKPRHMPDEVALALRSARMRVASDRRYSSSDFTGRRGALARTASEAFSRRAAPLVRQLGVGVRGALTQWSHELLFHSAWPSVRCSPSARRWR